MSAEDSIKEIIGRIPEARILSLGENLSISKAESLMKELQELNESDGDILCEIDCKGGNFYAGIETGKALRQSRNRVIGLATGQAMSAGFMTLLGCVLRAGRLGSTFAIHNPEYLNVHTTIRYDTTEEEYIETMRHNFRIQQPEVARCREETVRILLTRTRYRSREELEEFLQLGRVVTATEALSRRFINAII